MTRFALALTLLAAGCGDDDGSTPDSSTTDAQADATAMTVCPDDGPDADGLMGPCCFRKSNAATPDALEFRMAGIAVSQPTSLASPVVEGVLSTALNSELFNWLLTAQITGTDVMITTGFGRRANDSTYSFDDTGMFPPVNITGALNGESITTPAVEGSVDLPVFTEDGMTLQIVLPIANVEITNMTLTEDRSCVGVFAAGSYRTMDGSVQGFITVDDAKSGVVAIGSVNTSLCALTAQTGDMSCDDVPQAMWQSKPDSLCMGDPITCTQGGCDPDTECNAWQLVAGFSAHGVEVTP
ncbi:MAG: hypothetical protein AAGF12_30165 [Myxococcota bacterium]